MQLAAVNLGTIVNDKGDIMLSIGDAGMTVLIGLVIVFSMLVSLTLIILVFGKVMDSLSGKGKKKKTEPAKTPAPKTAAPAAPIVEEGISPSVVAAIAAAVASVMGKGKFTLRKITRASGRKAWGSAGAADNVRPF